MTIISRCGSWAVLVVQNLQSINCHTFNTICPILPESAIPPMRYTNSENRMGGIAKTARIEHIVQEVLQFGDLIFKKLPKRPTMVLGTLLGTLLGRSWGGSGALLGRSRRACYSRPGMLQPPRHVTGRSSAIFFGVVQAGLLHAALGSLLRLSSSLSSLSCLVDSPSGRVFPMLHRFSIDFTLTNRTW